MAVKNKQQMEKPLKKGISRTNKVNRKSSAPTLPVNRMRSVRAAGRTKLTNYIKPMLSGIYDKPFSNKDWIFEVKWDGYRAIAEVGKSEVKLYSRNGLSFNNLYPRVAHALTKFNEQIVLDGEIVVLNENHKPDFQKLQQYDMHPSLPIVFYVFDCLSYKGKSLTHLPLIERKKILQEVIPTNDSIIKFSDHIVSDGEEFFKRVVAMDLEGMIAKKADSIYYPGKRSKDWLKIKNHNTQEAIIAGYTAPKGSRTLIGALVLAIREHGKLRYIGHTGTGFTNELLKQLHATLEPLKRSTSPFESKIPVNGHVTWVDPKLVCAIKFTEITADGILRHPVFMGLRIDKSAAETTTIDKSVHTDGAEKRKNEKLKSTDVKKTTLSVDGHDVTVTNQNKVYWPDEKITKGDVLHYYSLVHQYLLPYLKDRPQSLRRNPNGIRDEGFFQKDAGDAIPDWIKTVRLRAESAKRDIDYIICNDLATLLYLNNLGCIEINPWNSRTGKLDYPDYMVLDIDPSEKNSFDQVIETAQVYKDVLDKAGAPSYCKTSGASGLHIYVPLHAQYTYEKVREFAEIVSQLVEQQIPKITTTERALNKRNGRIYLDYQQNKKGQTLASVYSLRPKEGATVSTPLLWKEVKTGLHPSNFTIHSIIERLKKKGDLFQQVLVEKINLSACIKNLNLK